MINKAERSRLQQVNMDEAKRELESAKTRFRCRREAH